MNRRLLAPLLLLLAAGSFAATPAFADSRAEHPVQVQFDTGGVSVGYHINDRIYVGGTYQPTLYSGYTYGHHYDDSDTELYGQKGVDSVSHTYAQRTALEVRYSPWPFGLYFAAGVLTTGNDEQKVNYDDSARAVGDGGYSKGTTDLRVDVKSHTQTALAGGVGFNHVFRNGFSLGLGLLVALRRSDTPDVTVVDKMGTVSQSDLNKFKKDVEDDNRGPQGMLHLAAGWNF